MNGTNELILLFYLVSKLRLYFTTGQIKLEYLSLASQSNCVYCLWVMLGAYPKVEHLKGLPSLLGSCVYYDHKMHQAQEQNYETFLRP